MPDQYQTLAELKAAHDSGELTGIRLMLDNDSVDAYTSDDDVVFSSHPAAVMEQALNLLGIPWEHV